MFVQVLALAVVFTGVAVATVIVHITEKNYPFA
jgi:hypothetical protein